MKSQKTIPHILEFLSVLGGVVFFCQLWFFANTQQSIGDEGSYLFKGFMFVRGDYYPFQEYAFWTNKAPLAFIIPGTIQYWFGPGLREGRYFAILLAILMLIGIWIVSNRLAGKAWAALAVWVLVLSNWQTAILSQALSQGIVACMLTWVFVLVSGEGRKMWQLVAGSILAVLIVMTRQNMLPVPILVTAYIFWQHGKRAGWFSFATIVITFLGFYLFYGPKLLTLWLEWLPNLQTPFDRGAANAPAARGGFEISRVVSRFQSFAANIHNHVFVFVGTVSAIILWPSRHKWINHGQYKTAIFLAVTYFLLFLMHVWASIFNNYCVWCLPSYQVFYNPAGLVFIILFFSTSIEYTKIQHYILLAFFVFVSGSLGLYYYNGWGEWLLKKASVPLPSRLINARQIYTVPLVDVFTHYFALSLDVQKRIASFLGGVFIGLLFIVFVWAAWKFTQGKKKEVTYSATVFLLAIFLVAGMTAPIFLDGPIGQTPCGVQFLSNYEDTGRKLASQIPPGVLLYWKGSGRHLALMLYMTDVKIFPPQIHAGGGDYQTDDKNSITLLKIGRFNKMIDEQWRDQADYHVVWSEYLSTDVQEFYDQFSYKNIPFDMEGLSQCEDQLFVYGKR